MISEKLLNQHHHESHSLSFDSSHVENVNIIQVPYDCYPLVPWLTGIERSSDPVIRNSASLATVLIAM